MQQGRVARDQSRHRFSQPHNIVIVIVFFYLMCVQIRRNVWAFCVTLLSHTGNGMVVVFRHFSVDDRTLCLRRCQTTLVTRTLYD